MAADLTVLPRRPDDPAVGVRPASRPRGGARAPGRGRAGYLMVAPAFLHMLVWTGIPVVACVVLAFTAYDVITAPRFNGLANFAEMARDTVFLHSIVNTVVYTVFVVPVAMAIALVIATMLHRAMRARWLFRTAIFIPHVTATIAVALVWLWMYNPVDGLFNTVLGVFGVTGPAWLSSTTFALPSVILVGVWKGIGLKMLIYLAALQALPADVYEAAEVDGASRVRQFFSLTVPMLRPATFFVFVTSIVTAFQSFDQIYVLTNGGPANATTMMTYQIYVSAFREFRMGYGCAESLVLLALLILLTVAHHRIGGGSRGYQ